MKEHRQIPIYIYAYTSFMAPLGRLLALSFHLVTSLRLVTAPLVRGFSRGGQSLPACLLPFDGKRSRSISQRRGQADRQGIPSLPSPTPPSSSRENRYAFPRTNSRFARESISRTAGRSNRVLEGERQTERKRGRGRRARYVAIMTALAVMTAIREIPRFSMKYREGDPPPCHAPSPPLPLPRCNRHRARV